MPSASKDLTVTDVRVITTEGANKSPASGEASFSDGKSYDWGHEREQSEEGRWVQGDMVFYAHRVTQGGAHEMVRFKSPRRAAALTAYLNTNDVTVHVIQVAFLI